MTPSAQYAQIFQNIIFPISVNMMDIKSNIYLRTANTDIRKTFHSIFFITCVSIFIRCVFFSFFPFKADRVFFAKKIILTLFATCSFFRCYLFKKINYFRAILASKWNFFFRVPFMKACRTTEQSSIGSKTSFKFNLTVFARYFFLRISRFLSTRNAAKFLSNLTCRKYFFTRFTSFFHIKIISHFLNNEKVKLQEG